MSNAYNIEVLKNAPRASRASTAVVDIWTPASTKLVRVQWLFITVAAACVVTVQFEGVPTLICEIDFAAANAISIPLPSTGLTGSTGKKLQFFQTSGGAVIIGASAAGREES